MTTEIEVGKACRLAAVREGGTALKRREFLIGSTAAAAGPVLGHAATFALSEAAGETPAALATTELIWAAQAVPVPIEAGGHAEQIASSADGPKKASVPDLHCVFAKEIMWSAASSRAVLHLFTFTRYRLYVNGKYAGRGPCRYQNQRPEYDSVDIQPFLNAGRNVVAVLVHRDAPTGRIMRHEPGFVAVLEVTLGGRRVVIPTDSSWLSIPELSFGPRAEAWASIEEHIDARKSFDWRLQPDLKAGGWQPSRVVSGDGAKSYFERSSPPQRETLRAWSPPAAFPMELSLGREVALSLPEIAQAYHLLELDAEAGSLLELTYALPGGEKSGRSSYIARDGLQTYMGGDTFAFRHLRLTLKSGRMRLVAAQAYEMRYPLDRVGSFSCSDPFLDQLWTICARSIEVLSEDSYVDCADRERVEWTDDSPPAFDCTRVMMRGPDEGTKTHWGDARLLRGLLRRIAATQMPDGQIKAHSCSERFDIHAIMEDRSCDWVVLLREYYDATGNGALVRELWPTLMRLLEWFRQRRTGRALVQAREWEVWDNPLRYQVCEGTALNAMVYRALVDASALAKAAGKSAEAARLAAEAEQLRKNVNEQLWNEHEGAYDGGLFGPGSEIRAQLNGPFPGGVVDGRYPPTAQANLFAIYGGIVPAERLVAVRSWVLRHRDLVIGPMSHYYLFAMMYAMDEEERDREIIATMKKGWELQVESEWQTSWEELVDGAGSKLHTYSMHPGYFLTAYVLGARREGSVEERMIVIEPRFSGLAWAKGVCVTEFGPVAMEWKRSGSGLELACEVPAGARGRLRLRSAEGSVLSVNGRSIRAEVKDGRLEAILPAGKHGVKL